MSLRLRLLFGILIAVLLALQFRLWVGEGSLAEVSTLKIEIAKQERLLAEMQARNDHLKREVDDLRKGLAAVESRARRELGLIRDGETFYQVIPKTKTKDE